MPKPLNLFIRPPYKDKWTLVHSYGLDRSGVEPVFHNEMLLSTSGEGEIFAAANGKLSIRSFSSGLVDPSEDISIIPDQSSSELPDTITIYLKPSPFEGLDATSYVQRANEIGGIAGFVYFNIAVSSLEAALADFLDDAVIPQGKLSRSSVLGMFLRGYIDIYVNAGHSIGKASTKGASQGTRRVGFSIVTSGGAICPSYVYELLRDYVADPQNLDAFFQFAPKRWPVLNATDNNIAINLTQTDTYSMNVLQEIKTKFQLNNTEWRRVGDHQKRLWINRLLKRSGHAPESTVPYFEYGNIDLDNNLFKLEAVVEFYANYDDPWAGINPREQTDYNYIRINFLNIEGENAECTTLDKAITLGGKPELSNVSPGDLIWFENDTVRNSHKYKILSVIEAANMLFLDEQPVFSQQTSAWKIVLQPILVLIDSFGGRIQGNNAIQPDPDQRNIIQLDIDETNLRKVNKYFDTIYLSSDQSNTHRPRRSYRITDVDVPNRRVTLNATPNLNNAPSNWHIPAGVSGELPTPKYDLDYDLGPGGNRGYDHYDGMMFVVYDGAIQDKFRWTSYTSRNHTDFPSDNQKLSSVRGNRKYNYASIRSHNSNYINYSFKITSALQNDLVQEARYYFVNAMNATNDKDGKTGIRPHLGNHQQPSGGNGSDGCPVSPVYYSLRDLLITRYQQKYREINNREDPEVARLQNITHEQSVAIYNNNTLAASRWNNKLQGIIWIIRPDEKPLP